MVLGYIAISAIVVLSGIVWYMYVELLRLRKQKKEREQFASKYGTMVEVSPIRAQEIREYALREVEGLKEIMDMTYYACDNFSKYQADVSVKLSGMYDKKLLQGLCYNIVSLANMVEQGALYKLSEEFNLTELELRTCCFIHLGFKWQETCTADSLTENAYNVRCSRIRKKLGLSKDEKIPVFISEYCNRYTSALNSSGQ